MLLKKTRNRHIGNVGLQNVLGKMGQITLKDMRSIWNSVTHYFIHSLKI